jgi:hypothetical protein
MKKEFNKLFQFYLAVFSLKFEIIFYLENFFTPWYDLFGLVYEKGNSGTSIGFTLFWHRLYLILFVPRVNRKKIVVDVKNPFRM